MAEAPPVVEVFSRTVTLVCPETGPQDKAGKPTVCLADLEAFIAALRRHRAPDQTVIPAGGLEVTLSLPDRM